VSKTSFSRQSLGPREALRVTRTTPRACLPIVFTGLSVAREEASMLGRAHIRPPVKRGDLDKLDHGQIVAIVDGELNPATVLPRTEVMRAMRRGVEIHGAASVGALRAFELRDCGMTGCGWVYDAYCTGRIAGADEIAVTYDPMSHQPLSVPLANIRFHLDRLVDDRRIARTEADASMLALKSLSPEDRTAGGIARVLGEVFGDQRIETLGLATGRGFDIKKRDALQLIWTLTGNSQ
jgi:hypothetical protein